VTLRSHDAGGTKRARLQFSIERFQAGLRRYDTAFSGSIKKIQLRSVPPAGRGGRYQFDDAAKACIPMGTARR
jgi:hypothetical protein